MTVVFVTAVPLGILGIDVFILCVALFSYYLALSGWRAARNRSGQAGAADWAISTTMLVNVTRSPAWIAWLLPLIVITPLIVMMNRRVLNV